jgi:hypothetical protein
VRVPLPWRDWLSANGDMGSLEGDQGATVAMLHGLHGQSNHYASQKIDIVTVNDKVCVFATAAVAAGQLSLPPCIPKQSKVVVTSIHPLKVLLKMTVRKPFLGEVENDDCLASTPVVRTRDFYVLPEFKSPNPIAKTTEDTSAAVDWNWGEGTPETMHPFWAIRRMSKQDLVKDNASKNESKQINCAIKTQQFSAVNIGWMGDQVTNLTRFFDVPFMTNICDLKEGDELIMENDILKKTEKRERTWKDDYKLVQLRANTTEGGKKVAKKE